MNNKIKTPYILCQDVSTGNWTKLLSLQNLKRRLYVNWSKKLRQLPATRIPLYQSIHPIGSWGSATQGSNIYILLIRSNSASNNQKGILQPPI